MVVEAVFMGLLTRLLFPTHAWVTAHDGLSTTFDAVRKTAKTTCPLSCQAAWVRLCSVEAFVL